MTDYYDDSLMYTPNKHWIYNMFIFRLYIQILFLIGETRRAYGANLREAHANPPSPGVGSAVSGRIGTIPAFSLYDPVSKPKLNP